MGKNRQRNRGNRDHNNSSSNNNNNDTNTSRSFESSTNSSNTSTDGGRDHQGSNRGRGRDRGNNNNNNSSSSNNNNNNNTNTGNMSSPPGTTNNSSFVQWLYAERQGIIWVLGCAFLGSLLGFGIGTGHLTGAMGKPVSPWRMALGTKIRATHVYHAMNSFSSQVKESLVIPLYQSRKNKHNANHLDTSGDNVMENFKDNPSHPRVFAVLREAIIRERGGYVHPDLGFMVPAPSGASRGVGMVRSAYMECQVRCHPGAAEEKKWFSVHSQKPPITNDKSQPPIYLPEEILIKVPLSYQMTRQVALDTLSSLVPGEVRVKFPLTELDDAVLLVLLLAHEKGMGRASRWLPYIASLPKEPSCGYSTNLLPYRFDTISALSEELGMDVSGWNRSLQAAASYADKIASALTRDYGSYLRKPDDAGSSVYSTIQWALCQVASRAVAGSEKYGALRMVPMMDLVNHDANAGSMVELTGRERYSRGGFVDPTVTVTGAGVAGADTGIPAPSGSTSESLDAGSFVVRSLRHGRPKHLKRGQELLISYNVPGNTALDWFVSQGFVPPERWAPWRHFDAALAPRARREMLMRQQQPNKQSKKEEQELQKQAWWIEMEDKLQKRKEDREGSAFWFHLNYPVSRGSHQRAA